MIVPPRTMLAVPLDLESPHVVAEFDPRHEPRLGEFRQVAVDRRPVEPAMIKRLRHLRMRLGPCGGEQVLEVIPESMFALLNDIITTQARSV